MKSSIILPLLALAGRVLAVPPACLLDAVNTQDEPSDLSAICGADHKDVQQAIASLCGNNQAVAQSAFVSTCSGAGSSVGKTYDSDSGTMLIDSSLHRNLLRRRIPNFLRYLRLHHRCL